MSWTIASSPRSAKVQSCRGLGIESRFGRGAAVPPAVADCSVSRKALLARVDVSIDAGAQCSTGGENGWMPTPSSKSTGCWLLWFRGDLAREEAKAYWRDPHARLVR